MISLNTLRNSTREKQKHKRIGRGIGSGMGKMSGRGHKGSGSRAGYKRPFGREGGQFPLWKKLPIRGFSNAPFRVTYDTVNLKQLDAICKDGDVVNIALLKKHGLLSGRSKGLKILGDGKLTKKVTIEAAAISSSAQQKLQEAGIKFTVIER